MFWATACCPFICQVPSGSFPTKATVFENKYDDFKRLGDQGLSDSLRGTSARFSQTVVVCELVTFALTTCLTGCSPGWRCPQYSCYSATNFSAAGWMCQNLQGRSMGLWLSHGTWNANHRIQQENGVFWLDWFCVNKAYWLSQQGETWCNQLTMKPVWKH